LLAVFGGYLGLDKFYLGEWGSGFFKMSTLGGFGLWWFYDIARIGSTPIYASDYRVAADLPHGLYVFLTVVFASIFGYFVFGVWCASLQRKKMVNKLLMAAEDEFTKTRSATVDIPPQAEEESGGMPERQRLRTPIEVHIAYPRGYGTTAPGTSGQAPRSGSAPWPGGDGAFRGSAGRIGGSGSLQPAPPHPSLGHP
jgi:hypothetical protein